LSNFLSVPAEGTGLSRYLDEIRRFPMLEPQEEFMLAKKWQEHEHTESAHKMVTSHLRLVAKIAMGYRGYGLPINEIISEGNVGLMQGQALRPRSWLQACHLRHVVDPRRHSGVHSAFLVARENGHHGGAEKAVLQSPEVEGSDAGHRGW